jgi:DNA-binding SARP family transcriptional activator
MYLTGNVSAESDDRLVPEGALPGRQGRVLLAALAWERDRALGADEVAGIVWDDAPPQAWDVSLRALASKLRSALSSLGDQVRIDHGVGAYHLRLPADAWVDVEGAGAAVHAAETALRDGDLARATGEALVANAIARRPFLHGEDGTWIRARRDHLDALRFRALEVRGRSALARGYAINAVTDAELIIEGDPYRETAYALLMRAQAATGNGAQAIATYERLRTRLRDDLGIGPSPATEEVYLQIMRDTR